MGRQESLYLVPVTLQQANDFASKHIKDYRPVPLDRFCIGCGAGGKLVGVIIVGYPKDSELNDAQTLVVLHICATGGRIAYEMLYGAAARAAKALGYWRIIVFQPVNVSSSALRAAGWRYTGAVKNEKDDVPKEVRYEKWLAVCR